MWREITFTGYLAIMCTSIIRMDRIICIKRVSYSSTLNNGHTQASIYKTRHNGGNGRALDKRAT